MNGTIRIKRRPDIITPGDGKAIYIPAGAKFRASSEVEVLATVETVSAATIEADTDHVLVEAKEIDNFSGILIGTTEHIFVPAWASSDPSPGKPETAVDWKKADLRAVPISVFTD